MREIVRFGWNEIEPPRAAVLDAQGIPADADVPGRIEALLGDAFRLLGDLARPAAVVEETDRAGFAVIFPGEGRNEPGAPLAAIFPKADRLALYAATLGEPVCEKIASLFAENDFALGSMLDAAAGAAADLLSTILEERYAGSVAPDTSTFVLGYSPGYCGWHVSGQRRLFERLRPGEIGITLRESFLMDPIKSVSGVLVAGPAAIHAFDPTFPFCRDCRDHPCRPRLALLKKSPSPEENRRGGPRPRRTPWRS